MFKTLFATLLLSASIGTPTLKADVLQPKKADNINNAVYGSYNLKNTFDDIFNYIQTNQLFDSYTYDFNTSSNPSLIPICFNNSNFMDYSGYLKRMIISAYYNSPYTYVKFEFNIDTLMAVEYKTFNITINDDLTDIQDVNKLIISFNDYYYLSGLGEILFNGFFTTDDNYYTTTYSGYYNFVSSSLANNTIFVTGNTLFNQSLYYGFDNWFYDNGNLGDLLFNSYDVENGYTKTIWYEYPFTSNQVNVGSNLLLTNSKMTNSCYQYMASVGVFSYVKDSSFDNSTFKDLLFSLMDSPLYMITQLLSFELFGVNMFVALTGLLTIIVILILIRKFW